MIRLFKLRRALTRYDNLAEEAYRIFTNAPQDDDWFDLARNFHFANKAALRLIRLKHKTRLSRLVCVGVPSTTTWSLTQL